MMKHTAFFIVFLSIPLCAEEEETSVCEAEGYYHFQPYNPEEEELYRERSEAEWPGKRDDVFMDGFGY